MVHADDPKPLNIDRRLKPRYPVQMEVRFRALNQGRDVSGVGTTIDMSSEGLLISAQCPVRSGMRVEIILEWPLALEGSVPLQLVILGKVVRQNQSGFAIEFRRYQFRTKRRRASSAGADRD
jgi:hypothetical protein